MLKCYLHGETAQPKKTTPLKTHPGFPEDSFKQGLALALVSKPQTRDLAIQPYRHWEFEKYNNEIKELKKSLKDLKEEAKKREEKFLQELEQNRLDHQLLIQEKNEEIAELNNKLNQLITRIMNISEKPTGTFDPELKKQKGIKELLERYSLDNLEELVAFVDKTVKENKTKPETNQELKDFLDQYSATNLAQVVQILKNNEQDYLERIETLLRTNQRRETGEGEDDNEETEELIAERDQLARDKGELEAEVLAINNRLKLKQQEVNNKENSLENLKKEKDQAEISLNKKITEKNGLITTLTGEIRDLKKKVEELEKPKAGSSTTIK